MNSIFKFIVGTKKIRVVSGDIGRFMSECVKMGVHIWDIQRIDEITVIMCIYAYSFDSLSETARRLKSNITVIGVYSIADWFSKYRHRKIFASGFLICLIMVFLPTCFIKNVSVSGNETVPSEEIIYQLEQAGFKKGMLRFGINVKEIQNRLMINYDKLAWIWIDIHGTSADISLKERIPKPEMEDKTDYCNCVASHDGLITEIMPRSGKQIAFVGDVVQEGDVLISGISETKTGEVRYMHADGIVTARTWYEADGVYNHIRRDRYLTGNVEKNYGIRVGKDILPFFHPDKTSYLIYEHEQTEKKFLKFLENYLPMAFTIDTYCEIIEKETEIDDKEVVDTAVDTLGEQLGSQLEGKNDLTVINKSHTYEKLDDGNIYVKVQFECSENIARYKKLDEPQIITEE